MYLRDSGELTSAAALLGVAHETGFPLYCLVGRLVMYLPLGEVAFRAVLVSAAGGALATAAAAVLVARLVGAPGRGEGGASSLAALIAGVTSGVLLGATGTFFKAATVAEVYAPTAAAMALLLLLLHRACCDRARARREQAGALLGLGLGLGLGLHASLRLLLLPLSIAAGLVRARRGDRWPLRAPLWFAAGALAIVYLPVRAHSGALAQWGEPQTLLGLWRHLSAARIRDSFHDQILSPDLPVVASHLREFAALLGGQIGGPALGLAAVGLGWLGLSMGPGGRSGALAAALGLGALIAGDAVYAAWINPMGIADWQDGVPCALGLAVAAGCGLGGLGSLCDLRRSSGLLLAAIGLLVLLPAVRADRDTRTGLGSAAASRFSRAALSQVPPRGLLLPVSDDLAAGALYEQGVAGDRPDVTVLVRQFAWDARYLGRMAGHGGWRWLSPEESAALSLQPEPARVRGAAALIDRIVARAPWRVAWEPYPADPPPPGVTLSPGAPVARLVPGDGGGLPDPAPIALQIASLLREPGRTSAEPLSRLWGARSLVRAAEAYLLRGDRRAGPLLDEALRLAPDFAPAWIALGVLRAQAGDLAGALRAVEPVLARDPEHVTARLNAGRYLLRLGDPAGAAAQARHVLARSPDHAGARRLLQDATR